MPVPSSLTPKSALRHRPLDSAGSTKERPKVTRASRPAQQTNEIVPPVVCSPQKTIIKKRLPQINLTSLGIGMIIALVAVLFGQVLLNWWDTTWEDLHYGRPRTYQTDAFVGHETGLTPSHFIVLNLHSHIEILELPGGNPTKTKIYLGPQIAGPRADMVPVTVQFVDRQRTHHPDMVLHFQETQVLFRNINGTFQPGQS